MASITIRDLPPAVKESLRVKAAKSGVSLEAYVRQILQVASNSDSFETLNILAIAQEYFGPENGIELPLPRRHSNRNDVEFDS